MKMKNKAATVVLEGYLHPEGSLTLTTPDMPVFIKGWNYTKQLLYVVVYGNIEDADTDDEFVIPDWDLA